MRQIYWPLSFLKNQKTIFLHILHGSHDTHDTQAVMAIYCNYLSVPSDLGYLDHAI